MKLLLFVGLALGLLAQEASAAKLRRVAVVVGANAAAPGRRPLRFAHADADNVAKVLGVIGLAKEDIHVLRDPNPADVLGTLDRVMKTLARSPAESMLFFYYSGHADAQALYPNGKPLKLNDLRARLDSPNATVRIGIIDACRGGGWTGTKGLSETEAFEVSLRLELSNEGSVLISSSSGLEDAHESEVLQGSFFTHHWNGALRGAGDANQDGVITLVEAFEYAKSLTVRDTALHTATPQHPSFQLNLRGQRDLELVTLSAKNSVLRVEQQRGPLQLIHLDTGLIVLEIPRGKRKLKLAVPHGDYLVRRRDGAKTAARQIHVKAGVITRVNEEQLEIVGTHQLVAKSFKPRPVTQTTLSKGMRDLRFAVGVRHGPSRGVGVELSGNGDSSSLAGTLGLTRGITDRLQWVVPTLGFAYRGGTAGQREWIPWGGLIGWGAGFSSIEGFIFQGHLGLGMDTRLGMSPQSSLNISVGLGSRFEYSSQSTGCSDVPPCPEGEQSNWNKPTTWRSKASIGYSRTFGDAVTLNAAVGVRQNLLFDGDVPDFGSDSGEHDLTVAVGSIQNRALRSLPLIQLHVSDGFTIDGHSFVSYNFDTNSFADTYMLGATWIR